MRQITGWHVFGLFGLGFGIIIAVNLFMAFQAVHTFPGLEVENSYVASQKFDAQRAAQQALGWDVRAHRAGDVLRLSIRRDGEPVEALIDQALLSRPTTDAQDRTPAFVFDGRDYVATVDVPHGNWDLRVRLTAADGTLYQKRLEVSADR